MNPCHTILLGDGNSWRCLDTVVRIDHPIILGLLALAVLTLIGVALMTRHDHEEHEELEVLRDIDKELHKITGFLEPQLSSIKIRFTKGDHMAEGPVTLSVGQKTTATIDGFDQNGAAFTGTIPPVTFSIDNSAIASSTPNSDGISDVVAGVSGGVANLTASLTSAEGKALTDTETVTVTAVVPVLSSIKVNFSTPA